MTTEFKRFFHDGRELFLELEDLEREITEREADENSSEIFIESEFSIPVRGRDKDSKVEITLGKDKFIVGSGFYSVVGFADSGKTTLLLSLASKIPDCSVFAFGESLPENVNNLNIIEKPVRNHKVDFITFSQIINDYKSVIFIDSLDFLMPYNKGFGMESSGIPKGPFQTIWALDKACKSSGLIIFGVIPVDDRRPESLDRYYEKLKIKTSGVIMPKASLNRVKFSLRMDLKTRSRISDREGELFNTNLYRRF